MLPNSKYTSFRKWVTPPHYLKRGLTTLPYFIVDRLTLWSEKLQETTVVNDVPPFGYGRENLVAELYKPETKAVHVRTVRELNEIVDRR